MVVTGQLKVPGRVSKLMDSRGREGAASGLAGLLDFDSQPHAHNSLHIGSPPLPFTVWLSMLAFLLLPT